MTHLPDQRPTQGRSQAGAHGTGEAEADEEWDGGDVETSLAVVEISDTFQLVMGAPQQMDGWFLENPTTKWYKMDDFLGCPHDYGTPQYLWIDGLCNRTGYSFEDEAGYVFGVLTSWFMEKRE